MSTTPDRGDYERDLFIIVAPYEDAEIEENGDIYDN